MAKNIFIFSPKRKDARVVEWDGLENRCTGNCTEGSNPSLSAFAHRSFSVGGLRFLLIQSSISGGLRRTQSGKSWLRFLLM